MDFTILQNFLDAIPGIIGKIREVVIGILEYFNLDSYYPLAVFILAMIGSYYLLKQFVSSSLLWKLRTILNMIFIAFLLFLIFVYIK